MTGTRDWRYIWSMTALLGFLGALCGLSWMPYGWRWTVVGSVTTSLVLAACGFGIGWLGDRLIRRPL